MRQLPLLLVSALVGAAFLPAGDASAQQKVYRWKDASGRIHYSGTPPRSGTYQVRSVAGRDLRVPAAASIAKEPAHCVAAQGGSRLARIETFARRGGTPAFENTQTELVKKIA